MTTHIYVHFSSRFHKIVQLLYSKGYNQLVDMNIFNNGTEQYLQNKQGHLNVSGNHNIIHLRNCNLTLSVNGNHNAFDLQYSNINLQVNGNANRFRNHHNNLTYGFNGNNNEIMYDQNSSYTCTYSNGTNNRVPNGRDRPRQQPPFNQQQERQRNRSNDRQNRQRSNRPQNQYQDYQNRRQPREPREPRQPRQPRQHPWQQMHQGNRINRPYQQENMPGFPFGGNLNFLQHIQASLNAVFQPPRGRQPMQFQFRPNRNIFVFHEEQEQENRGLTKELYDLLPRNQHKGKATNCTICLDDISEPQEETFLICFHAFHSACIKDWLIKSPKCPVCQYDLKQYFTK